MKIALIVAMSKNRVIGSDNRLPWHLSADLRRFKAITMGKPILMGRKTHESIGRPLPGRKNIILTSDPNYRAADCVVVHSPEEAMAAAEGGGELMIIGGSSLYERFLPEADRIYLTLIDEAFSGDTFFPALDRDDWVETEREEVTDDPEAAFKYCFLILERRRAFFKTGSR
jgi:dihydrofolate reductase